MKSALIFTCILFSLSGCSSSSTDNSATPGNSNGAQASAEEESNSQTDSANAPVAGSGSIQSIFNGFMLSSLSRFDGDGSFEATAFYLYDSVNRTITRRSSTDSSVTAENASIRSISTLTEAGLPDTTSFFELGSLQSTQTRQYDLSNKLLSIHFRLEFNGQEQLQSYEYNDANQPVLRRTIDLPSELVSTMGTFQYGNSGLLETVESSIVFIPDGPFLIRQFQHDSQDRLSGWSAVFKFFEEDDNSQTYTWDDNNNIVQIDSFSNSGELTERIIFEYVEVDDLIYNQMLFDYVYNPSF